MMKLSLTEHHRFLLVLLLCLLNAAIVGADDTSNYNYYKPSNGGAFTFLKGSLGALDTDAVKSSLRQETAPRWSDMANALTRITQERLDATGQENFLPATNKTVADTHGDIHARFTQTYHGLEVVDAAMILHVDNKGDVYAVNGEFVADGTVDMDERVTCEKAFAKVLDDPKYESQSKWMTDCERKIVIDQYGVAHKAFERLVGYQPEYGPYQKDKLYASVVTGDIVAIRPQVLGAMSIDTRDCHNHWQSQCDTVSHLSAEINTPDDAINDAHNYAIATYRFFNRTFGRDSIDGKGLKMVSNVHFGEDTNYAHWDNWDKIVYFGDGDGKTFSHLSGGVDIVAHEFSHGLTSYSSRLIEYGESGALNEAISDIFGACVEYSVKASHEDIWLVGEDVYTPETPMDALRNMADPKKYGDCDFYPERARSGEYEIEHTNAGIVNLAFVLMVEGGHHPRNKTTIEVPPMVKGNFTASLLAAANIFYKAETDCLTPMSRIFDARACTMLYAGDEFKDSVQKAWEAVGVDFISLKINEPLIIAANKSDWLQFHLSGISPGSNVTCTLSGDTTAAGDADLFMEMPASQYWYSETFCVSQGWDSNEECTVGPSYESASSDVFVSVKAFDSFAKVTLSCAVSSSWIALAAGVESKQQKVMPNDELTFYLPNIPPMTQISCEVSTGNAAVYMLMMGHDEGWCGYDDDGALICQMESGLTVSNSMLVLFLYAQAKTSDLTVTCSETPAKIDILSNWALLTNPESGFDFKHEHFYRMEERVKPGERVTCSAMPYGDEYISTLSVFFSESSKFSDDAVSQCDDSGSAECTTSPATKLSYAFVEVSEYNYNWTDDGVLNVICGIESPAEFLLYGNSKTIEFGHAGHEKALRMYRFPIVLQGQTISCSIEGGADGDADLYMDIGQKPHILSEPSFCQPTEDSSTETCVIQRAPRDGKVFVAVHAVKSYTDLTLRCNRTVSCKAKGQHCLKPKDCCGSAMTCDGLDKSTRVCKRAIRRGAKCTRSSQCRRGVGCQKNGRCNY